LQSDETLGEVGAEDHDVGVPAGLKSREIRPHIGLTSEKRRHHGRHAPQALELAHEVHAEAAPESSFT
jgi:hypothetical protein